MNRYRIFLHNGQQLRLSTCVDLLALIAKEARTVYAPNIETRAPGADAFLLRLEHVAAIVLISDDTPLPTERRS